MDAPIDPTANPEGMQLDAEGNPIPEKPTNISEEVKLDMDNIWYVFDVDNKGEVAISELKTMLRALDVHNLDEDIVFSEGAEVANLCEQGLPLLESLPQRVDGSHHLPKLG